MVDMEAVSYSRLACNLRAVPSAIDMATYTFQEAIIDLPDLGFVDRTIHVASIPIEAVSDGEVGIFVHRAEHPERVDLRAIARAEIEQENTSLLAFAVLNVSEIDTRVGPAVHVATQWRGLDGMGFQRLGFNSLGPVWLLVGVNAASAERARADAAFARLRDTLTPTGFGGI